MKSYKLYKDDVSLSFDEAKHMYTIGDKTIFGVTSIVNCLAKPALMYWAVNQSLEHIKNNITIGKPIDEVELTELLRNAKVAHTKTKDKAADIGTMIHEWVSNWILAKIKGLESPPEPVNEQMKKATDSFVDWAKDVEFVASEEKIYSKEHGYAGTLDVVARIDGKPAIVDIKTSNGIYPSYFLQVSAYEQARREEYGTEYDGYVVKLSKAAKPIEVQKKTNKELRDWFPIFLACHEIYKWEMANKKA